MTRLSYILIIVLLTACKQQPVPQEVTIEGNVKNVPDGVLYLVEAHHWKIPLDSTLIKNGHFTFKLKADSSFAPFKASLQFPDSTSPSGVRSLFYRNFTTGADSMKYSSNAFFLERGQTRIEGDYTAKEKLRVFAGPETRLLYDNKFAGFGWPGHLDSVKRLRQITYFKNQIRRYPFSYFLLSGIYNAKEQYSEEELKDILSLFDIEVQASKPGKDMRRYLALRPDAGESVANLFLVDAGGERHHIIDSSAKLNMLVFWASWCGPCRQEIPALKQIFSNYAGKDLKMVSISIDEDKDRWKGALEKENMNWPQYIVDPDLIQEVRQQYNFAAIPLIVFTDGHGNEIKRFLGNTPGDDHLYINVIKSTLKIK